ncbi:hypothetical protein B0H14DRAFT_2775939 [Mycena olivaceomarginata]|nr:hypothetical protein B0H14DRAFT_2775939 [Mycena olivaceomarginata]
MSSDEDHEGFSVPAKKRRVQRACDMCRRKKSDGLRMSEKKCTNCIENGLAYVDALEARLELTEQLLRKGKMPSRPPPLAPNAGSQWSDDSPVTASNKSGPGVMIAALNIRSMNTPAPAPHGKDLSTLSIKPSANRFQGKSSGPCSSSKRFSCARGMRRRTVPWSSRRMHYWTYNPVKHRVPHVGPFVFPDPDLLRALVDLYFIHKNLYFPVLHRPTFDRSVAEGLHTRDPTFEPLRCGWEFFDQLPFHLDHLFETPTIHHLQYYCDVGAHRQREGPPTVESELWKRGFWVLVSYDRQVSMSLGRSCATQYDDIDAELPIECDDDFWENEDPTRAFYALNKTKKLLSYRDQAWEEHLVAEMDSALNGWSLPSLAICTNAARSCSHIAEMSRLCAKTGSPVPVLISSVFVSGVILLLNVWSGKRTGLPPHMNSAITEVQKCMATMRVCETKWQIDLLHELATIGQVPLPVAPHSASDATTRRNTRTPPAPPAHPPTRSRPLSSPPSAFAPALHPSPTGNQFWLAPDVHCRPGQAAGVHQRTPPPRESTSSCTRRRPASPLGRPDFAVGIVPPDAGNTANSLPVDPLFASEPDYALGGSNLSNDVMAMWADCTNGF